MLILKKLLTMLLPNLCLLCKVVTPNPFICERCFQNLPWINPNVCTICANPLSGNNQQHQCGQCQQQPPAYDNTFAIFYYCFPIDRLILRLKFSNKLVYAKLLAHFFCIKYQSCIHKPDFIIPIPLHANRMKQRGFNQSHEIAKIIAKKLQIPVIANACERILDTQPQLALPANLRTKNIRKAFQINQAISAQAIAIVDDVVTTGSTVQELAKLLKKQGVKRVDIWCCAKTFNNSEV
jgi:ComF family protein